MTSKADQEQLPDELAQIEAEASALNPPPAAADASAPTDAKPSVDFFSDASDITSMVFEGLGTLYPSTLAVTLPRQARFAGALSKVMEKRGWSLAALLGRYGAEIELAFVASTMAIPLYKAIAMDRAAAAAVAEIQQRQADPQPARPAVDPYGTAFAGEANGAD